jgi:hypothetical protein
MLDAHHMAAARALGCSHLVAAGPPVDEPALRAPLQGDRFIVDAGPQVYLVEDPLPEAFVVRRPSLVRGVPALLDAVAVAHSSSAVGAVVDDPLGRLDGEARLPEGDGVTSVALQRLAATHLRLHVSGQGAAVVGVRQSFWTGWSAHQGERVLPVLRIAGQQLGVVVEDASAGAVELHYRLPRAALALALALAGLSAIAASFGLRTRNLRGHA